MFHPSLSLSRPAWLFPTHLTLPVLRWCLLRPTQRAWPQHGVNLSRKTDEKTEIFQRSSGQARKCANSFRDDGKSEQSLTNAKPIFTQWTWNCLFYKDTYWAATYPLHCLTHRLHGAILSDRARHRWTRFPRWVRWSLVTQVLLARRGETTFFLCIPNRFELWHLFLQQGMNCCWTTQQPRLLWLTNPSSFLLSWHFALDLGPSNRCSSSSSSRTLTRPALTFAGEHQFLGRRHSRRQKKMKKIKSASTCKRETGLVRHGTNMHKTCLSSTQVEHIRNARASLQVEWVDSVNELGFFDARIVWTKLYDASRLFKSDFSFTDLTFVTFWVLMNFSTPSWYHEITSYELIYIYTISLSCAPNISSPNMSQILGLPGHSPSMGMHLGKVKDLMPAFLD